MKKRTLPAKLGIVTYLLLLPVFLFVNCQNEMDEPVPSSQFKLTQDSRILSLMEAAIISDSDGYTTAGKTDLSKSADASDDQCTHFLYPMTFDVYSGDDPTPVVWEINSDEELLAFIETLKAASTTYEYYIHFPITLLDTDGNETVLNNLTELEGTLQMAVEACEGMSNDPVDASDGSDGGTDSGTDNGGTDSSTDNGGTDSSTDNGGTDSGTDNSSDGSGSSDDGSDGSDDGSTSSDESSDDDSTDDSSNDDSESSDDDSSDDEGSDDDSADDEVTVSSNDSNDSDNGYQYCDKKAKKVIICHKGKTICISVNAIWGHMQHHEEDYMGSCDD